MSEDNVRAKIAFWGDVFVCRRFILAGDRTQAKTKINSLCEQLSRLHDTDGTAAKAIKSLERLSRANEQTRKQVVQLTIDFEL